MARGRMLNRKVATSGKVAAYGAEYGPWALVFHHRLIAFLDKNGNCRADPAWFKAEIFPRVAGVLPEDCRRFAAGLVKHGLAVLYEHDGMPYLHMPGFRAEQVGLRVDREAAEVPVPEGFDEKAGAMPEDFRQPAGYDPAEVEIEVEGEVKDITVSSSLRSSETGPAPFRLHDGEEPETTNVIPLNAPHVDAVESPEDPATDDGEPDVQGDSEPDDGLIHGTLAPLIREHWWGGKTPPPDLLRQDQRWNMGRELNIAKQFIRKGEATLEEMADVIRYAKAVHNVPEGRPFSFLFVNRMGRRDVFYVVLDYVKKRHDKEAAIKARREQKPFGNVRVHVA